MSAKFEAIYLSGFCLNYFIIFFKVQICIRTTFYENKYKLDIWTHCKLFMIAQ